MLARLQVSSLARDGGMNEKRGVKDLLLCAIVVGAGALGLLLLLATSTQDLSWATAVVPVRLMIILIVAWFNVGFQVCPSPKISPHISSHLLTSPHTTPYLPISPQIAPFHDFP